MIHMIIFAAASSPFQRKDGLASGKLLKKKTTNWMFYHVLPIKNGDFLLLTLVYQRICSCMSQVLRQWAHL